MPSSRTFNSVHKQQRYTTGTYVLGSAPSPVPTPAAALDLTHDDDAPEPATTSSGSTTGGLFLKQPVTVQTSSTLQNHLRETAWDNGVSMASARGSRLNPRSSGVPIGPTDPESKLGHQSSVDRGPSGPYRAGYSTGGVSKKAKAQPSKKSGGVDNGSFKLFRNAVKGANEPKKHVAATDMRKRASEQSQAIARLKSSKRPVAGHEPEKAPPSFPNPPSKHPTDLSHPHYSTPFDYNSVGGPSTNRDRDLHPERAPSDPHFSTNHYPSSHSRDDPGPLQPVDPRESNQGWGNDTRQNDSSTDEIQSAAAAPDVFYSNEPPQPYQRIRVKGRADPKGKGKAKAEEVIVLEDSDDDVGNLEPALAAAKSDDIQGFSEDDEWVENSRQGRRTNKRGGPQNAHGRAKRKLDQDEEVVAVAQNSNSSPDPLALGPFSVTHKPGINRAIHNAYQAIRNGAAGPSHNAVDVGDALDKVIGPGRVRNLVDKFETSAKGGGGLPKIAQMKPKTTAANGRRDGTTDTDDFGQGLQATAKEAKEPSRAALAKGAKQPLGPIQVQVDIYMFAGMHFALEIDEPGVVLHLTFTPGSGKNRYGDSLTLQSTALDKPPYPRPREVFGHLKPNQFESIEMPRHKHDSPITYLQLHIRDTESIKTLCDDVGIGFKDINGGQPTVFLRFTELEKEKTSILALEEVLRAWGSDPDKLVRVSEKSGAGPAEAIKLYESRLERARKDRRDNPPHSIKAALRDERRSSMRSRVSGIQGLLPFEPLASTSRNKTSSKAQATDDDELELPRRSLRRSKRVSPPVDLDPTQAAAVVLVYPAKGLGPDGALPAPIPGAVPVTHGDTKRLQDGEFLNDTLIEFGLKYIFDHLPPELQSSVHIFNSFFYKKLSHKPKGKTVRDAYQTVRKWTSKTDLFSKKYIVVPINEHLHWYLAIIVNPAAILVPPKNPPASALRRKTRASGSSGGLLELDNHSLPVPTEGDADPNSDTDELADDEKDAEEDGEVPGFAEAVAKKEGLAALASDEEDAPNGAAAATGLENELQTMDVDSHHAGSPRVPNSPTPEVLTPQAPDAHAPLPRQASYPAVSTGLVDYSSTDDEADNKGVADDLGTVSVATVASTPLPKTPRPTIILPSLFPPGHRDSTLDPPKAGISATPISGHDADNDAVEVVGELPVDKNKCYILIFDSLGGSHKQAFNKLQDYLTLEASDKRNLDETQTSAKENAVGPPTYVPQQNNFCDCGLYLLHYVEQILKDPVASVRLVLNPRDRKETILEDGDDKFSDNDVAWKCVEAKNRRQVMRALVAKLSQEWKELREPIDRMEAEQREAKKLAREQQRAALAAVDTKSAPPAPDGNSMEVDTAPIPSRQPSPPPPTKSNGKGKNSKRKPKRGKGEVETIELSDDEPSSPEKERYNVASHHFPLRPEHESLPAAESSASKPRPKPTRVPPSRSLQASSPPRGPPPVASTSKRVESVSASVKGRDDSDREPAAKRPRPEPADQRQSSSIPSGGKGAIHIRFEFQGPETRSGSKSRAGSLELTETLSKQTEKRRGDANASLVPKELPGPTAGEDDDVVVQIVDSSLSDPSPLFGNDSSNPFPFPSAQKARSPSMSGTEYARSPQGSSKKARAAKAQEPRDPIVIDD